MRCDKGRYERLTQHGLSNTHRQAIEWVPRGSSVLELGCSTGFIGERLIEERGCRVMGLELDSEAAVVARARGLEVREGSLEDEAFRRSIDGAFDVVMATDVIEHLHEPEPVLADMRRWVRPAGLAIVAVPNVAVWSMRVALLGGEFDYRDTGLCDRTHLRFFTRASLHRMVSREGWRIAAEMVDAWEVPGLQRLMFDGPNRLRAHFPETTGRFWQNQLFHGAGRVLRVHQWLGRGLGQRWPNLCANHFALLLRPVDTRRKKTSPVTTL